MGEKVAFLKIFQRVVPVLKNEVLCVGRVKKQEDRMGDRSLLRW